MDQSIKEVTKETGVWYFRRRTPNRLYFYRVDFDKGIATSVSVYPKPYIGRLKLITFKTNIEYADTTALRNYGWVKQANGEWKVGDKQNGEWVRILTFTTKRLFEFYFDKVANKLKYDDTNS